MVAGDDAHLVVRNSTVGGNGSNDDDQRGLEVYEATVELLYTTLAGNDASSVDSIRCEGGMVIVRNSIVVGRDVDSIICGNIEITHSALEEDWGDDEDGNEGVGAFQSAWFTNVTAGDYRLSAVQGAQAFAGIARWQFDDPSEDIDGDPRPDDPDTPDHAGADIP